MDAQVVWHVWRRVLREERIQKAMFSGDGDASLDQLGLDTDEREVVAEYQRAPAGTRFFIASYRFRMVSSYLNALETGAPLTHRLLRAHRVEIDALAREYLQSVDWLDAGPYVYAYAERILDDLLRRPALVALPGLAELVAVERAAVRVTIDSAPEATVATPTEPTDRSERSEVLDVVNVVDVLPGAEEPSFRAIGPLAVVPLALDISIWLRDSRALGRVPAPRRPRSYLVYLRRPGHQRRIVAVPPLAAEVLAELATARSVDQLTAALDQRSVRRPVGSETALLDRLVQLGVVAPVAATGG